MPKLEYFIVCESVSVDQTTNAVSLFNVYEDVRLVPAGTPTPRVTNMVAVCCWLREENDEAGVKHRAVLRIHREDTEPQDMPLEFDVGDRNRMRLFFRFQGPFPARPGQLRLEILLNDEHQANHVINILGPSPEHSEATNDG